MDTNKQSLLSSVKLAKGIAVAVFFAVATIVLITNPFDNRSASVITVSGMGEIQAVPDVSRFSITVQERAENQSLALAKTSEKINAVIAGLKNLGIEEKDIKTENVNTYPEYEYVRSMAEIFPPTGSQQLVGYSSSHTLSVKVRTLELVPAVQQLFADQKITMVNGPQLSIDDTDVLEQNARQLAIIDAKDQAKILAKQLGVRLGKIVQFSDSQGGMMPMYRAETYGMAMDMAVKSSEPTIATGEQTITSQVSITYRIK